MTVSKILCFEPLYPPQSFCSRRGVSCHSGFIHNAEIWESLEASAGERWHLYFLPGPLKFTSFSPLALPSLFCPKVMPRHLTHTCSCSGLIPSGHALRSPVAQLVHPFAGQPSSRSVCVPRFPFWRNRTEGGWCMPKFQRQKKLRCHKGAPSPVLLGTWMCRPISSADVHSNRFLGVCGFSLLSVPSLNPTCFHTQFLLSSCIAAFGCHKVTPSQLCHSSSDHSPSLPTPQQHHLPQLLLRATFLHLTTFPTVCLPKSRSTLLHSLYPGTAGNTFL